MIPVVGILAYGLWYYRRGSQRMSFPRHLSIRIAAVISDPCYCRFNCHSQCRKQDGQQTPWYQLREAFVDEVSCAHEFRLAFLRSAMENISASHAAQDMELFLNVWQSLEGLKQQPSAAGVELAVRNWLDLPLLSLTLTLMSCSDSMSQNSIEISG